MIYEFIWNKNLIDMRKHFPVNPNDFPHIKTKKEYKKFQRINERKNRKRKGILVADIFIIDEHPTVCIGWSLCKFPTKERPKGNKFNFDKGIGIATGRAIDYGNEQLLMLHDIPLSIQKHLKKFIERCRKYFHVDDQEVVFSPWINTFINCNKFQEEDSLSLGEFIGEFK